MVKIIDLSYERENARKMEGNYKRLFKILDKKTNFLAEKVTQTMYKENNRFLTRTEEREGCFLIKESSPLTRFFLTLKNGRDGLSRKLTLEMEGSIQYLDNDKIQKKAKSICGMLKNAI